MSTRWTTRKPKKLDVTSEYYRHIKIDLGISILIIVIAVHKRGTVLNWAEIIYVITLLPIVTKAIQKLWHFSMQ